MIFIGISDLFAFTQKIFERKALREVNLSLPCSDKISSFFAQRFILLLASPADKLRWRAGTRLRLETKTPTLVAVKIGVEWVRGLKGSVFVGGLDPKDFFAIQIVYKLPHLLVQFGVRIDVLQDVF
jgi:hypothetical protein